jgi:malonyl CoA-acyl carrier protein transacylase
LFFIQDAADATKGAMVSVVGLDSEKVQQLCDAANQEVPEAEKVQIANYLCPVRFLRIWLLTTLCKILFLKS